MLIALSAEPDTRLTDSINQLRSVLRFQAEWGSMTDEILTRAKSLQGVTPRYELFATVPFKGSTLDLLLMLELEGCWVPHHRSLYNGEDSRAHGNSLRRVGNTVAEFETAWNWATQLAWTYVPVRPHPLLTVLEINVDGAVIAVDQTVAADVRRVGRFPQDRTEGTSDLLIMSRRSVASRSGLTFGEFPSDYSSVPNRGSLVIRGSGSGLPNEPPPESVQVLRTMHFDLTLDDLTTHNRASDLTSVENTLIKSIRVRVPTEGASEHAAPLVALSNRLGLPTPANVPFNIQFPAVARLAPAYTDLSPDQCINVLEEQRGTLSEQSLTIAGLDVPTKLVVRWGQIALLCALAYFLTHGREADRRLRSDFHDAGWEVPWLPLYRTRQARILTWLTAVALPVLVAGMAFRRTWNSTGFGDRTMEVVLSALVIAAAAAAWDRLRSLHKTATERECLLK